MLHHSLIYIESKSTNLHDLRVIDFKPLGSVLESVHTYLVYSITISNFTLTLSSLEPASLFLNLSMSP